MAIFTKSTKILSMAPTFFSPSQPPSTTMLEAMGSLQSLGTFGRAQPWGSHCRDLPCPRISQNPLQDGYENLRDPSPGPRTSGHPLDLEVNQAWLPETSYHCSGQLCLAAGAVAYFEYTCIFE